jgi:predicted ATP-grasp superfamily ATP-dependent carboligase
MKTVFVTDGEQRPALAITRSLGKRGISVVVGEEQKRPLAASSRYCARSIIYPSPYREPEAFERFITGVVTQEQFDVVMPVTDVTTYAVARNQDAIRPYAALAVPPFDAFERLTDKASLLQRARKCGIPTPRTHVVEGLSGLNAIQDSVTFPAVVKPTRSRIPTPNGWLGTQVHYVSSLAELRRLYRDATYLASYPSLIQERIVGDGVGVFVLCDRGRTLTAFQHTRLRERPPSGGVSVLSRSEAVDPVLRSQACRLLEPLGWHGVAMLEYKRDATTGTPVLMEVNGRFWGSLQLSIDAGVDFPYLNFQLALGRLLDLPASYRVGQRTRWWVGDLDHMLSRVFGFDPGSGAQPPTKFQAAKNFLRSTAPGVRNEITRIDDLAPACREFLQYARDLTGAAVHHAWRPVAKRVTPAAFHVEHKR